MENWGKNILDETNLKFNIQFSALFILHFETLKDFIVDKARDFYCDPSIENGEMVQLETKKYKNEVRKLDKYIDNASLKWFQKMEAVTNEDYNIYQKLRTKRNEITHEYLRVLTDGFLIKDLELLNSMLSLYKKLDKWWIINYEIPIAGDYAPEDYDESSVCSGQALILDIINDIVLHDSGEKYKDILEELSKYQ